MGEGLDQTQKYILDTKIGLLPAIFVKLGLTCSCVWAEFYKQPKKHWTPLGLNCFCVSVCVCRLLEVAKEALDTTGVDLFVCLCVCVQTGGIKSAERHWG